ncbi:MAG: aspartate carbamoyltransferase regulatory subunit [Clostridia bacterium]
MHIDSIKDGVVIDHIEAGKGLFIYNLLDFGALDCPVAIITNVNSKKMGKKDIIKLDAKVDLNFDVLGYIDTGITVDIIRDGKLTQKKHLELPEKICDVISCKNPRCISTTEQSLQQVFELTDRENKVYRCLYCEAKA